ncbi:MAG TPA: nitroreductase family deazaflavin-dependent oxidoreductase [Candidatus Dormibacteraeota bacterium]|nr:nitroreductase family deazaflavin-dependent oxidoreductase [Candidatus Dormibacteraeota bacterium]
MSTSWHDMTVNLMKEVRTNPKGVVTSGPFKGRNVLLLTTKGAKSGEERTTPLVYSREQGQHVIVASKGGAPTHPSWYHNLRAHPIVTVEAGGEKFQAEAKIVGDEDYERLYKQHADPNPGFWDYRKRTTRHIPVVVLERIPVKKH